jgi:Zn-dependent protease/predicted transcriptional regulator
VSAGAPSRGMARPPAEEKTPAMAPSRGIDLVRIAGIQIAIDFSWVIIFLLVLFSLSAGYFPTAYPGHPSGAYWAIGSAATLLFFASVVIHELAHAVVANRLGQPVRRITLFVFGGMAHLSREPRDPRTEMMIAGVGPLTSLLLAGVFSVFAVGSENAGFGPLWVAMFSYLGFINLALAVFNLLPGFPLDGGRLLRGFLWLRWGDLRRATARAADWGSGIAFGLMALGMLEIFGGALVGGLWLIFIGMFLRGAARASYRGVLVEEALSGTRVRDVMIDHPVVVPGEATVSEAVEDAFLRHGFGGFPVGRDHDIEGLVSLRQVRALAPEDRRRRTVREVMQPAEPGIRVSASAPIADALKRMVDSDNGRLLVTDGSKIVGLVTRTGITRFIQMRAELAGEESPDV